MNRFQLTTGLLPTASSREKDCSRSTEGPATTRSRSRPDSEWFSTSASRSTTRTWTRKSSSWCERTEWTRFQVTIDRCLHRNVQRVRSIDSNLRHDRMFIWFEFSRSNAQLIRVFIAFERSIDSSLRHVRTSIRFDSPTNSNHQRVLMFTWFEYSSKLVNDVEATRVPLDHRAFPRCNLWCNSISSHFPTRQFSIYPDQNKVNFKPIEFINRLLEFRVEFTGANPTMW